ncbi:MAG: N-acetylmuramoyl-L-alanine amidase [Betaproteobacteria bacterium RBG_16_58_11]|nr:MAG: N-acetylmuramoyl-L-alanine amidase [Betaproteobacteria bacterium RBG_16_58_11]
MIIDSTGVVIDPRVRHAISPALERGDMKIVHGIIVHQTGSSSAAVTLNGYKSTKDNPKPSGAHFLIDKDGTIYQTVSIYKKAPHVGFLKSRCVAQHTCSPTELKALKGKKPGQQIGEVELKKKWPSKYPSNADSIGIEIVGEALPKNEPNRDRRTYESVTKEQQASLQWLVQELSLTLNVRMAEVFRHPIVSWKNETEASTATW